MNGFGKDAQAVWKSQWGSVVNHTAGAKRQDKIYTY